MSHLNRMSLAAGELEANEGTVTKHPNLRVAYVAQHAFHHIEKHLDKTPNEYIQWRYAGGEDREEQEKVSRQVRLYTVALYFSSSAHSFHFCPA